MTTLRPTFVVVPGNPYDTTPESLSPLLEQLRESGTAELRTRSERGYGVTFIEVILIYVIIKAGEKILDRALDKTLDAAEEAGSRWWQHRRLQGARRPATVLICDEDGNVLRALDYTPESDDPTSSGDTFREKRLPPPAIPSQGND